MKGFVKNKSHMWAHAMKRAVGPGQTVPLEELYNQYGKKHDLQDGREFTEWLATVKLQDTTRWEIVVEEESAEVSEELTSEVGAGPATKKVEAAQPAPQPEVVLEDGESNKPTRHFEVADVVGLTVRAARDKVPEISDLNLLKYALQEANQLSGKDTLCQMLRKRILELE
ncbi:hypothetical protein DRQ25_01500 [Candidatus Fermentibacteria bacterium]|nr:MAG: hypothetical protein DRQ25_01500 [Candidatus Fermentibacteria bacterium]